MVNRLLLSVVISVSLLMMACAHSSKGDSLVKEGTGQVTASITGGNGSNILAPLDYVQWVRSPENGLMRDKTMEDLVFSAQYKPYEYITCLEEKTPEIKDTVLKQKSTELEGMQYIDFKIALKEGSQELLKYKLESNMSYEDRVKYFSFGMQKDVSLVEHGDTIPCTLYHFERAYDVTPYSVFLLGFDCSKTDSKSDKTLVFEDKIFHKGIIKLTFSSKDLNKVPKLRTL